MPKISGIRRTRLFAEEGRGGGGGRSRKYVEVGSEPASRFPPDKVRAYRKTWITVKGLWDNRIRHKTRLKSLMQQRKDVENPKSKLNRNALDGQIHETSRVLSETNKILVKQAGIFITKREARDWLNERRQGWEDRLKEDISDVERGEIKRRISEIDFFLKFARRFT